MRNARKPIVVAAVLAALAAAGLGAASLASGRQSASASATTLRISAAANGSLRFNRRRLAASKGRVTIVMRNPRSAGVRHGVAVEGHGVDKNGRVVRPGRTSTLTVTLRRAGRYTFYCPFDSHRQQGMKGALVVS